MIETYLRTLWGMVVFTSPALILMLLYWLWSMRHDGKHSYGEEEEEIRRRMQNNE